jgi:micrococcal nuclease
MLMRRSSADVFRPPHGETGAIGAGSPGAIQATSCFQVLRQAEGSLAARLHYSTAMHPGLLRTFLWFTILYLPAVAVERPFSARVVGIIDGDTIVVVRTDVPDRNSDAVSPAPIRIRLFGIDTPERGQEYYVAAKVYTASIALGKTVTVVPHGRHFQRLVAEVVLEDGRMLGHELVGAGLAWWYERYASQRLDLLYLQNGARAARRGLWADALAVAPWSWRLQVKGRASLIGTSTALFVAQ